MIHVVAVHFKKARIQHRKNIRMSLIKIMTRQDNNNNKTTTIRDKMDE